MLRIVTPVVVAAIVAFSAVGPAPAQNAIPEPVALDARSAARALDAVPAVFAVAQNVEGVDIDVDVESMANGFSGLADQEAVHEQLTAALGSYGFEGYADWAATIRKIFSTYAYVRSKGANDEEIKRAVQRALDDPGLPQSQKDAIVSRMSQPLAEYPDVDAAPPSQEDLAAVIALVPHIETTIEMMRAMQ